MTIEQVRAITELSPGEGREMIELIVFDVSTVDVEQNDMPSGYFWRVEQLADNKDISRLHRDGVPTALTIENYKWEDPNSPMFRGSIDGEQEFFGQIDAVLGKVMDRENAMRALEERTPQLAKVLVATAVS